MEYFSVDIDYAMLYGKHINYREYKAIEFGTVRRVIRIMVSIHKKINTRFLEY